MFPCIHLNLTEYINFLVLPGRFSSMKEVQELLEAVASSP